MLKRKTSASVRPEPPSFAEITQDINAADDDDIIFSGSSSDALPKSDDVTTPSDRSPTDVISQRAATPTAAGGDVSTDSAAPSDRGVADVDAIYREAVEFIRLTAELKDAPAKLNELHDKLQTSCAELAASVQSLKHQVDELQANTQSTHGLQR